MSKTIIKCLEIFFIATLVMLGVYFRLSGISSNHSFWSDEAYVSSTSRDIVNGNAIPQIGVSIFGYQRMQVVSETISFMFFGFSEWSARFLSVIWGSVGILFAYLLAKKISNKWGGFLSAFLYTIFQLNLAHSTQAKPYSAVETLFLITIFLSVLLSNNIKRVFLHLLILFFCALATLYNSIGIITFIPYLSVVVFTIIKYKSFSKKYFLLLALTIYLFILLKIYLFFPAIINPQYNWISLFRELFWRQFGLFTLPALFGYFVIKDTKIKVGIGVAIILLLYSWTFVAYSHNIRYLMPMFGLIIVFFGVFWAKVGETIFKKPALICLLVAFLVYAGGYKVVRKPAAYYTPNADFLADVQNADFKTFFKKTYELFPDFNDLPVFVGPFDTLCWYTEKKPTAIFSINTPKPIFVDIVKSWQYGSLNEFKNEQGKYKKGLVVVNDWQSFMPDEIKEYVKKNMKLELRVESMTVSPNDKWPLELYSWGMDKKSK